MSSDYKTALNEMLTVFNTAWQAGAAAIVGYIPQVRWPDVEEPALPGASKYWARVSIQVVQEGEIALGRDDQGKQRYGSAGLIGVQVFGPMTGDPLVGDRLRSLAILARDSFGGQVTASGVWFTNARIQPLVPDGDFARCNAVAEYQYQEYR